MNKVCDFKKVYISTMYIILTCRFCTGVSLPCILNAT